MRNALRLSLPVRGVGGAQNPADWPALKCWFKCDDGSGSLLADSASPTGSGSLLPLDGLTITTTGSANPWATAGAFTSKHNTGDGATAFARDYMGATLKDLLVAGRSIAFEIDYDDDAAPTAQSALMNFGRTDAGASSSGFRSGVYCHHLLSTSGHAIRTRAGGATALSAVCDFDDAYKLLTGRRHILMVWDRSATSLGTMDLYVNGIFQMSTVLSTDPGAMTIASTNATSVQISVGETPADATDAITSVTFYEARLWMWDTPPADLAAVALQMASNPAVLPALMQAIS